MMFYHSASISCLCNCGCDEGFRGNCEENGWDQYTPFSSDALVPMWICSLSLLCSSIMLVPESASSRLFLTGPWLPPTARCRCLTLASTRTLPLTL